MISAFRKSKNLTQEQLANKIGVKRTTVSMWESGESSPRATLLPKIADVLGCTVDELLREGGETDGRAEGEAV